MKAGLGHRRCLNWRQLEQAALVGVWDDVLASKEWSGLSCVACRV
jgi:hypothetical protein